MATRYPTGPGRHQPLASGPARLRIDGRGGAKPAARAARDLPPPVHEVGPIAVRLYENAVSGNCHKVRLLLGMLGIEYESHALSVTDRSGRAPTLGGLSPTLNVPTVVLEDGRPLAESNAILWYFADGTRYLPDDPYERAQVLQWMFFEQYKHEPGIAVVRFWVSIADERPPRATIEARRAQGYAALDAMERHLADRELFVGERLTIADLCLYAYTHVAPEGGFELDRYPAIRAWLARVEAEPGVERMAAPDGGEAAP